MLRSFKEKNFLNVMCMTFLLVVLMIIFCSSTVFADLTDTYTITYKSNANVVMGTITYNVGEDNELLAKDKLTTEFSDFFNKVKENGNIYVKKEAIWYTDPQFKQIASMPEGKAGENYEVYCGLTNATSLTSITNDPAKDIDYDNPLFFSVANLGANYSCDGRYDAYMAIKATFEKKVNDSWVEVDNSYYMDSYNNEWSNVIFFRNVSDSGEYRVKELYYEGTDNDGNVLYYDYANLEGSPTAMVRINPVELSITDIKATSRDFDGTLEVELSGGNLEGIINNEDVDFELGKGTLNDKNVGKDKSVITNIVLTGDDKGNYVLKQPTDVKVDIHPIAYTESVPPVSLITTFENKELKDVKLPEGFYWKDNTLNVGDIGEKTFSAIYLKDNHNYFAIDVDVKINVIAYTIATGEKPWQSGDKEFKSNGNINDFIKVLVDNVEVDESHYTVIEGSTIIIIEEGYLNSLKNGKHIMTIVFKNKEISKDFIIEKVEAPLPPVIGPPVPTEPKDPIVTLPTVPNTPNSKPDITDESNQKDEVETSDNTYLNVHILLMGISVFAFQSIKKYQKSNI